MSYTFEGEGLNNRSGWTISEMGDVDGDGVIDYMIGSYSRASRGTVEAKGYLISGTEMAAMDAADGTTDCVIDLGNVSPEANSYQFISEGHNRTDELRVSKVGDIDGDGLDDILISTPEFDGAGNFDGGRAYLLSSAELAHADAADGSIDGSIDLANIASQSASYQFTGNSSDNLGRELSSVGDFDGDGKDDFSLGGSGSVYLISAADLAAIDAADGSTDGNIDPDNIANGSNSYEFITGNTSSAGDLLEALGDVDGDGQTDFVLTSGVGGNDTLYFVSGQDDIDAADSADGTTDGKITVGANISNQADSYAITGGSGFGNDFSSVGDIDGDGKAELLVSEDAGDSVYLLDTDDFAAMDAADGTSDGLIDASNYGAGTNSYRFEAVGGAFAEGEVSEAGDVNGDGIGDFLIGAPGYAAGWNDAVFLISGAELSAIDAADGTVDKTIDLANVAAADDSYQFVSSDLTVDLGRYVDSAGDVDGDGGSDFFISAPYADGEVNTNQNWAGESYLVFSSNLDFMDAADGTTDGIIDVDNICVCFTRGTEILTQNGTALVEELSPGDMILTRDNGFQPLRWVGVRHLDEETLEQHGNMRPIRIRKDTFGKGEPLSDLTVSPQHRILLRSAVAEFYLGENEVLCAAKKLLDIPGVSVAADREVEYFHLLFDQHEVVCSNGLWTESLFLSEHSLAAVDPEARKEIEFLFPEVAREEFWGETARLCLKGHEATLVAGDFLKSAVKHKDARVPSATKERSKVSARP